MNTKVDPNEVWFKQRFHCTVYRENTCRRLEHFISFHKKKKAIVKTVKNQFYWVNYIYIQCIYIFFSHILLLNYFTLFLDSYISDLIKLLMLCKLRDWNHVEYAICIMWHNSTCLTFYLGQGVTILSCRRQDHVFFLKHNFCCQILHKLYLLKRGKQLIILPCSF